MTSNNKMISIEGVDGSGKGVQTRLLLAAFTEAGQDCILTREPGGSPAAEDVRALLVNGEPETWDSMTELLLMYAARRAHCRDTIWPALQRGSWVISDRFADSSRAFQGIAGELGLDTVEQMHALSIGDFNPDLVIILDIDESIGLQRAADRNAGEDRFEKKGQRYQQKVRAAFQQIAESNSQRYRLLDATGTIEQVHRSIIQTINQHFGLALVETMQADV